MEKVQLKLIYSHNWIDHPLQIITKIDDRVVNFDCTGQQEVSIDKKIKLSNSDHLVSVHISNKNESNTKIDENHNVIADSLVTIKSLQFDEIEVLPLINQGNIQSFYVDNQKDQVLSKITELGLNGTWEFKFKTPVYDWLLESLF